MPLPLLPVVAWVEDWLEDAELSVELELLLELSSELVLFVVVEASVPADADGLAAVAEEVVLPAYDAAAT
jgi:hypothetical protein